MKNILTLTAGAALLALCSSSFAAKPTSISFEKSGETSEGSTFATYTVKCSNGKRRELTAWDNRRKWCIGATESQDCENKQIKAAKAACEAA
jgi:hypothetical protein